MEAMRTGLRISGIVAIGLLFSTTARAQGVVQMSGCLGVGCVPTTNLIALMGTNLVPWWSSVGMPTASTSFIGTRSNENAQGNQNAQGDQDEDDDGHGALRLGGSTTAYTGIAFTLFVWFLKPSAPSAVQAQTNAVAAVNGQADGTTGTGFAAPLTAHLEFAQTSTVIANPEPATLALTGSGLFALGGGALVRRRRRRSNA